MKIYFLDIIYVINTMSSETYIYHEIREFLYTFFLSHYHAVIESPLTSKQRYDFETYINMSIQQFFEKEDLETLKLGRVCIGKFVNDLLQFCYKQYKRQDDNIDNYIMYISDVHTTCIYSTVITLANAFEKSGRSDIKIYDFPFEDIPDSKLEDMVDAASQVFTKFMCNTSEELNLIAEGRYQLKVKIE